MVEAFLYVIFHFIYPVDKLKSAFPSVPFYNKLKHVGCQGHQHCCFVRSTEGDRAWKQPTPAWWFVCTLVGIVQNVVLRFPQVQNVSVRFVLTEHIFFRCSPIFLVLFSVLLH